MILSDLFRLRFAIFDNALKTAYTLLIQEVKEHIPPKFTDPELAHDITTELLFTGALKRYSAKELPIFIDLRVIDYIKNTWHRNEQAIEELLGTESFYEDDNIYHNGTYKIPEKRLKTLGLYKRVMEYGSLEGLDPYIQIQLKKGMNKLKLPLLIRLHRATVTLHTRQIRKVGTFGGIGKLGHKNIRRVKNQR